MSSKYLKGTKEVRKEQVEYGGCHSVHTPTCLQIPHVYQNHVPRGNISNIQALCHPILKCRLRASLILGILLT